MQLVQNLLSAFANNNIHSNELEPYSVLPPEIHPLAKFYEVGDDQQKIREIKNVLGSYGNLYQNIKWARHDLKANPFLTKGERRRQAVEAVVKAFFNELSSDKKNMVYGRVFALAQVQTSDPKWGENHIFENIPRLILAMDLEGLLHRGMQTRNIWKTPENEGAKASLYSLGRRELSRGRIGFINGIGTDINLAKSDAERLSNDLAQGVNFHCVHNPPQGLQKDYITSMFLYKGTFTSATKLLLEQWYQFFHTHSNDQKLLQICFSQGALHVKNALEALPAELQKRICIVSIAPAVFIKPNDNFQIVQFFKEADPVPTSLAFDRHNRHRVPRVFSLSHDGSTDAHNLHAEEYTSAIRPFVERYIRENKLY